MSLSPESVAYTEATPIEKRKALGQYMTPGILGDALVQDLDFFPGAKVLDPTVGTGELLLAVQRQLGQRLPIELHGWDVDPQVLTVASQLVPPAKLEQKSALDPIDPKWSEYFDFIVGNPPYFELKPTAFDNTKFMVSSGRTNIYSILFEVCLPLLKEGGHLAFIVPPSMNAGAYFSKLREHILQHSEIELIKVVRENKHFTDALTSVQHIILKKTSQGSLTSAAENPYVVDFSTLSNHPSAPVIFTDNKEAIISAWEGKNSLYSLGYEASTGPISWNLHKSNLSSVKSEGAHLLYHAKDISSSNTLNLSSASESRRWLKSSRTPYEGQHILVNRIVGSLDSPKLKAALTEESEAFYVENHINVIKPRAGVTPKISITEIFARLTSNSDMSDYLKALTGNTQLSSKELTHLIPL